MRQMRGRVDKSRIYNGFTGNIPFLLKRTSSDSFQVFFILAIAEIDKLMENVQRFNGRESVKRQEINEGRTWKEIDIG